MIVTSQTKSYVSMPSLPFFSVSLKAMLPVHVSNGLAQVCAPKIINEILKNTFTT